MANIADVSREVILPQPVLTNNKFTSQDTAETPRKQVTLFIVRVILCNMHNNNFHFTIVLCSFCNFIKNTCTSCGSILPLEQSGIFLCSLFIITFYHTQHKEKYQIVPTV